MIDDCGRVRMGRGGNPEGRVANRSFTLVELLTVVAIILILSSLLMPALQNAVGSSRQAACASKMRQFGIAFQLYTQDYREWYPNGYDSPLGAGSNPRPSTWGYKLLTYLNIPVPTTDAWYIPTTQFLCPGDYRENYTADRLDVASPSSYALNSCATYRPGQSEAANSEPIQDGIFINGGWPSKTSSTTQWSSGFFGSVRTTWVPAPGQTMVVVDGTCSPLRRTFVYSWAPSDVRSYFWNGDQKLTQWHGFSNNFVFGDGHVAALTPPDAAGTGEFLGQGPKGVWTKTPND